MNGRAISSYSSAIITITPYSSSSPARLRSKHAGTGTVARSNKSYIVAMAMLMLMMVMGSDDNQKYFPEIAILECKNGYNGAGRPSVATTVESSNHTNTSSSNPA